MEIFNFSFLIFNSDIKQRTGRQIVARWCLFEVLRILLHVHNGIGVAGLFGSKADEVVCDGNVDIGGAVAVVAAA